MSNPFARNNEAYSVLLGIEEEVIDMLGREDFPLNEVEDFERDLHTVHLQETGPEVDTILVKWRKYADAVQIPLPAPTL